MADTITPQERAEIDEAVVAGKVQRIPRGQSAFEILYSAETGRLTYETNDATKSWRRSSYRGAKKAGRAKGPQTAQGGADKKHAKDVAARIEAVRALVQRGFHRPQILAEMPGLTPHQLTYALRQIGVCPGADTTAVDARRKRVAEMIGDGESTGPDIMAALHISRDTLTNDLKALGIGIPRRGRKKFSGQVPLEVAERRDLVAKLVAQGMTRNQIADAVNASLATIIRDAEAVGIKLPCNGNKCPVTDQRRVLVRAAAAEGLTAREIAERINEPLKRVRFDLWKMGIKAACSKKAKRTSTGKD